MELGTRIWIGVGIGAAALIAVPFLWPLDMYRAPIERAASAALGREIHINGPVRFAAYPQIGLRLSDVTIANQTGAREPDMVSIKSVLLGAKALPLLSQRLELTDIVLEEPHFRFEVNAKGEPNWVPASQETRPNPTAPAQPSQLPFNALSVVDGELSFFDARANKMETFSDIGVRLVLLWGGRPGAFNVPLNIAGRVTYNGEPLKIDAKIDRFAAMLNGQPTPLHVGIASNMVNADFAGTLAAEGRLSGALKMGARSVRSFAGWMGHPMPPGNGFGLIAIDGQFSAADSVYSLSHTQVAFDSMTLSADISIDTKEAVPEIKGIASINRLDVTPYLAPGRETDAVKAARAQAAAAPDTPLEFGWLKAANADVKLMLGELVTPALKLDQVVMGVTLKDGVLKADTSSLSAYGGSGKASLALDTSGEMARLRHILEVDGLKAQPLLTDLLGVTHISGTGAFRMDVSATGNSEEDLVKGLSGRGSLRLTGGALSGVDLAAAARTPPKAAGTDTGTEFARLGATFTVKDGVLSTSDFVLANASFEAAGRGSVDLPEKTLDFRLTPRARRATPGVRFVDTLYVRGPWDNAQYSPDAKAMPNAVTGGVGKNGQKIPAE